MITKNGSLYINKTCLCRVSGNTGFVDINGNAVTTSMSGSSFNFNTFYTGSSAGMEVQVGVGDTAPSFNDYKLAEREINGVDISTLIHTSNGGINVDELGQYSVSATFTNVSSQSVDIKEVGIVAYTGFGSGQVICLVSRDIIPTKTLAPSESVSLTVQLSPLTI